MPTIDRWNELDQAMDELIAVILAMPEERQHTPAVKGAFTPAQTLEHMALSEAYYLPMIRKSATQGVQSQPAKPTFLLTLVIRKLASASAVPTIKDMEPDEGNPDVERSADHWRQVRKKLKISTSNLSDNVAMVKHPIFGRMSVVDFIEIVRAHTAYHRARV